MSVFTYLVTKDVAETLERKIGYRLSREPKSSIKDLEESFLSGLWAYVPENVERKAIDASSVSTQLELASRRNGCPVVSLDRVYLTNADEYLEVTRQTNPKTGEIRIAERPGTRPLDEQINSLTKYKNIVLADVGAFGGETLSKISESLEGVGLEIEEIYLGFSSNEANRKINNRRKLTALNLFDFYEWIEMRDFFGIDGRSVGMSGDVRLYMPYWENLSKWASIPKENEVDVERLCKNYNKRLVALLRENGCDLRKIGRMMTYDGPK